MMGRQGSQDNTDQLMRDLQDAGEREQDLKDQLKFAEEEVSFDEQFLYLCLIFSRRFYLFIDFYIFCRPRTFGKRSRVWRKKTRLWHSS